MGAVTEAALDPSRAAKPVKTLFGWLLYRRISLPLSLRAARTPVLPWHLTAVGLACGLGGAALIASGTWTALLAGALLVNVAKVLDAMDGEVARVKGADTSVGYVIDGLCDRLRDTAVVCALGVGAYRAGHHTALAWTIGAAVGYLLFFYVSAAAPSHWREVRRPSDVDEKHAFRVTGAIRLGAGDTLAMGVLVVALANRPLWLVMAIAAAAPVALAVKVRRLFAQRPWEREARG